ncbi:leucine-rich repeat-containing protein 49-like isoform X2 [Anneissia japonica]|uniref:leucine-rich repeat-containing protein 49-like isoform X2 n=1 Tax=Anneissia japonica TaxID=1529436 RepID=UPI0014259488|nr:leucine-rich repeat-containing protein 49-like isoform X2 [Anneissia japonica]
MVRELGNWQNVVSHGPVNTINEWIMNPRMTSKPAFSLPVISPTKSAINFIGANIRPFDVCHNNPDFRLARDYNNAHRGSEFGGHLRRQSHPYGNSDGFTDRNLTTVYCGAANPRGPHRNRQVHHTSTAFATQLTDLTNPYSGSLPHDENPYSQPTRHVQSATLVSRTQRSIHNTHDAVSSSPPPPANHVTSVADKVIFSESPSLPGVAIVSRPPEERSNNPDRLNLDRRRLTACPILEGEESLRLLNFQHNAIITIERVNCLRRLIFLDLYDNRIEEISGLEGLRSLRVLMLGKNRIQKIENLESLSKLDVLDLHGNQIKDVENLNHLEELRVLNLAGNNISTVNNLIGMDSLTELNLRRNKITTVDDVDNLPNLQRLFLSFNCIASFDDIACLGDSTSLSELSLDGNPFSHDSYYKQTILRNMIHLKQLDMKRITDEERRMASVLARKEEEKKREINKVAILKEKKRIAINNAARQWEISKGVAISKTSRLQPALSSGGDSRPGLFPTRTNSRPSSAESEDKSVDLILHKPPSRPTSGRPSSARISRPASASRRSKAPTPDLLANTPENEVCHLAELDGDTLHLYGPGSLDSLEKNWGIQAAGAVTNVSFMFIEFDKVVKHLHKLRVRFPNVSNVTFGECNICNLQQLNALTSLKRLDSLSISKQGNPITTFSLWKQYLIYRLSHFHLKKINDEEVTYEMIAIAQRFFTPLSKLSTSHLPSYRTLGLLSDVRRKHTQGLTELELKAKRQLAAEQQATLEHVTKAGLQYYSETALDNMVKEQTVRQNFAKSYVKQLTREAIKADEKKMKLYQIWPQIFVELVTDAFIEMQDTSKFAKNFQKLMSKK